MPSLGLGIGIPFIRPTSGGGGNTPRVAAFLTATGITDATIISALNTMDNALISAGLLPSGTGAGKIKALYPFVGGTATTHKYNFVDPQDTDAAYRIIWSGGVTHNSNGVTGNGSNGYGNTFIKPTDFAINDVGISYLCSNTGIDGAALFGVQDASTADRFFHFPAFNGSNTTQTHINSASSANTATARQGFHTLQRTTATNQNNYRNGTLGANVTTSSNARATRNIYFLCYNNAGSASDFNASNVRILLAHTSLDATQAANLYTIQNAFQTTLGRAV